MADTEAKDQEERNDDKVEVSAGPVPRVMVVPGNDTRGYLGVSPEYMNYADPTQKPYMTEDEARLFTTMDEEMLQEEMPEMPGEGNERQSNEKHFVAADTATGAVAPRHRDDEPEGEDPYADPNQDQDKIQADGVDRSEPGVVKPAPTQPTESSSTPETQRPPVG